jgi:hypothetical protein
MIIDLVGHDHPVSNVAMPGTSMHFYDGGLPSLCIHAVPLYIFPVLDGLANMFACEMHVHSCLCIPV